MKAWWQFTKERFHLGSHIPMVALFTLGNFALSVKLTGASADPLRFLPAFLLCFMFFFRMRCFDEIKDYEVDLKVNPTRPLARGLLSVSDVKRMVLGLTVVELALSYLAGGLGAFIVHVIAMAYSFLMYKEFFIGSILRPHLTTYAVTHTFVSMLLGWSIASQVTGLDFLPILQKMLTVGPINWALFNLFEFARKTFAASEERPNVDSYSSLFKPLGAVALSLSQVAIALFLLSILPLPALSLQLGLALLPVLGGVFFIVRGDAKSAALFRNVSSAYLLLFYMALSWQGLSS